MTRRRRCASQFAMLWQRWMHERRTAGCAPDRGPASQADARRKGDDMTTLHTPGPWMFDCEPGRMCGFVAEEREDGRGLADLRPSQRIRHADKRRSDEFVLSE